jgi:hypothetical protein
MNHANSETLCLHNAAIASKAKRPSHAMGPASLSDPRCQYPVSCDQITGFQAIGTSRYFAPSFSTCPMEGKVKWKPTTVAFSAAAMS